MSSKSVSLAKSQNKQMQSTAKLKIYTSMNGWSKSKKRWPDTWLDATDIFYRLILLCLSTQTPAIPSYLLYI